MNTSLIHSLLFWGVACHATMAMAQSSGTFAAGTFTATGNMTTPRQNHTATLLTTGKVLIAGGYPSAAGGQPALASAELYDPSTGTFAATGTMTTARSYHTATLLPNGQVLIAGGYTNGATDTFLASAELYDPSTGTFTATGNMTTSRDVHSATLLPNGQVLIVGGFGPVPFCTPSPQQGCSYLTSAELYDPSTGTFTATGGTNVGGSFQSTLLPNGKVLIAGGNGGDAGDAEIYDPGARTFSPTGALTSYPDYPTAASPLPNGKVLVTLEDDDDPEYHYGEIYDRSAGTFTPTGGTTAPPLQNTATLLPDGSVLLAGLDHVPGYVPVTGASATLYDPVTGTFGPTGDMLTSRESHRATLLPDGTVLISGGWVCCVTTLAVAEIYHPASPVVAPVLFSLSGNGQGQGAIQHAGTLRIASSADPAVAGETLTIYGTGLLDGSVIPPQVAIGGRLAQVLWFGNTPGFVGLNQVNVIVPSGVAPGPEIPVLLNYIERPSNQVTIGIR
jgi:hypothetical protein